MGKALTPGSNLAEHGERERVADAVQREQRVEQAELALERPRRRAHPLEHLAEHRREGEDGLLRGLAVLAAPLGDRVQRVEEEVRVEVGPEREELRRLGLLGERRGARPLRGQARLEADVAAEPPPADDEERERDRDADLVAQEGPADPQRARQEDLEREVHDDGERGVDGDAQREERRPLLLREEQAEGEGRDEDERDAREHRGGDREPPAAVPGLREDERRADDEDRHEALRLGEPAERAADELVRGAHRGSARGARRAAVAAARGALRRNVAMAGLTSSSRESSAKCPASIER